MVSDSIAAIEYYVVKKPVEFVSNLFSEYNELKDVYKENKIFYIYLSSKEIISYDILSSLREAFLEELDYFSDIRIKMRYNGLSRKSNYNWFRKFGWS